MKSTIVSTMNHFLQILRDQPPTVLLCISVDLIPSMRNSPQQVSCVPYPLHPWDELFTPDIHASPSNSHRPTTSQLTSSSHPPPVRTASTSLNNSSVDSEAASTMNAYPNKGRAAQRPSSLESRSIDAYYKHLQRQNVERQGASLKNFVLF